MMGEETAGEIVCPGCGRHLRALRTARCNWCGTPISAEDFAAIAAQSQRVMEMPAPPPLPPVTSYAQQSGWGWGRGGWGWGPNPFSRMTWQNTRGPGGWVRRVYLSLLLMGFAAGAVKMVYALFLMWQMRHLLHGMR